MNKASNRQLTLLRKLNRKKYRYRERLFLLEGARAVRQIGENDRSRIKTLFFDEAQHYANQKEWKRFAQDVEAAILSEEEFAEVTDTDNPQGVLALCRMPDEPTVATMAEEEGLMVAFDGLQDPGNVGTIIRSASWFNAAGILSGKGTVDLFHPKVVRSTAGSTGTIPQLNGALSDLLPEFEKRGWSVVLLNKSTEAIPMERVQATGKTIIVVGNEAHGINSSLKGRHRVEAEILAPGPRQPVESLNAAIATSVALYALSLYG